MFAVGGCAKIISKMLVSVRKIQYFCLIMRTLTDIKAERKAQKLSQQDAAKALNCTRERISAIETGSGKLSIDELNDLAALYNCKILLVNCEKWKKIEQILAIL